MFAFLCDIVYLILLLVISPWLVYKAWTTGKYRAGLVTRFLGDVPNRTDDRPCVWLHAVSVGEVLMLRRVVAQLAARRPDVAIVVSTTTNTGMEVARQHLAQYCLTYFPLDFSWSVGRALARIRPNVVVLAELELWPNFVRAAKRAGAGLAVINGRMSPRSYRGYRRIRFIMRRLLEQIDWLAVQTDEFGERFVTLGAPRSNVLVTGSVKYDGVETDRNNVATANLRALFGIQSHEIVWVAGSTSDPEEQIVLDAYERLRVRHRRLRLIVVPRHKERFEEVSQLVKQRGFGLLRRSELVRGIGGTASIILVDTLGELSAVWGLADIAFVGGSFAPRGGQNMIEPAGYGAAVALGPGVWNFQDTVNHLLACRGALQVATADELTSVTDRLASDPQERHRLGEAARRFVMSQQGATERTIDVLDRLLPATQSDAKRRAA